MSRKEMTPKQWSDEFQEFMSARETEPPQNLSIGILARIRADLSPAAWLVFSKMALIHSVVGTMVLLFCPQFGITILPGMGLMALFMRFGETACMVGCGAVFLGSSALAASFFLRPEEVKVIRKNKLLQLSSLAMLSIGVFICLGASMVATLGLAWVIGSVVGGLATLELGWIIRSRFRRRIIHGI
ncbi:MAG: hypothetical protein AB1540_17565 [Bdellovibrionota bacterium]